MSLLDNMAINAKVRMWKFGEKAKNFFTEEKGVSNVVATIILVLIVVLIIGVFWKQLSIWLNGMMQTIFGSSVTDGDLKNGLK